MIAQCTEHVVYINQIRFVVHAHTLAVREYINGRALAAALFMRNGNTYPCVGCGQVYKIQVDRFANSGRQLQFYLVAQKKYEGGIQ